MKKTKDTRYRLVIKDSPLHGRGIFADEDIPWGKKIKKYGGAVIDDIEAKKRSRKGAPGIMELAKGKNIDGFDGGNGAQYVNHDRKNPNCFLLRQKGKKIWIVAGIEGIKAGDELTYDYGSDYYPRKGRRTK